MHTIDILRAVAADEPNEIRQAFRALVGYPRDEEITATSAEDLVMALDAACTALESDDTIMPSTTCADLICQHDATYADGANSVINGRERFNDQITAGFNAKMAAAQKREMTHVQPRHGGVK